MPTYGSLWPTYARQWDSMRVTRKDEAVHAAKVILANKARYQAVEAKTGVPWYWIGPTHMRESDFNWMASLAQGDRWDKVSTHVPRGHGPFKSWEEAAIDAIKIDGLEKVQDWRLEKLLYYWELYNGWGYNKHSVPSSYVWAGTSVQKAGKYIADGVWSPTAIDRQLGTAAVLRVLMDMDSSVRPARETPPGVEPKPIPTKPISVPQTPPAVKPSLWERIKSIFTRK